MLHNETLGHRALVSLHYCSCDFSIDRLGLLLYQGLETAICLAGSTQQQQKHHRLLFNLKKNYNQKNDLKLELLHSQLFLPYNDM